MPKYLFLMGTPSFSFVTRMFYFLNQHKIPPDIRTHKFKLKNPVRMELEPGELGSQDQA